MEPVPFPSPETPEVLRCKVAFWRDPHFYSAAVSFLFPILFPHVANHLHPELRAIVLEIYGGLVAAGIIAARRRSDTDLGLSSGLSSTQPGEPK